MSKDDSIDFVSSAPHPLANESGATATVLWINSPPTPDETAKAAVGPQVDANRQGPPG